VAYLADALAALGDPGTVDERRVKAVLVMANPTQAVRLLRAYAAWRARPHDEHEPVGDAERFDPTEAPEPSRPDDGDLLPIVHLFVHVLGIADLTKGDGGGETAGGTAECGSMGAVARVEGRGPITAAWIGAHLGPRCRFRITPVLDPMAQTPVDAYEIPTRHRNAVRVLSPADCFPYASSTNAASSMQIDHTEEYRPGVPGQSRIGNYGPMTTFHHRLKTHGQWTVKQPFPGVFVWRDGHGATYLVDHAGTRRIDERARTAA
jgi:hypothetical protein